MHLQICRLLDLCTLEISSLRFTSALLAASALSYFFGSTVASKVSGFSLARLAPVQRWMRAFANVIQALKDAAPFKAFKNIAPDNLHNIQTKSVELDYLVRVLVIDEEG